MATPTIAVKTTAKTILKGNFYRCSLATLMPVFISLSILFTFSVLQVVIGETIAYILLGVAEFFVMCPIILGILRFFRRLMWDETDNIASVFYYMSSFALYKKSVKYSFVFLLRLILVAVVVYLPSILIYLLSAHQIYEFIGIDMPVFIGNLTGAQNAFTALSTAVFLFLSLRFYLTPFLLVADEEMDIGEAIHMSKVISRKSTLDFIGLFFGLSFWVLISIFFIPLPFTLPYLILSYMVHCRFAVAHYNKIADRENSPTFYSSNF